MAADTPAVVEATQAKADDLGRKVFCGNFPWAWKEESLSSHFATSGAVSEAVIIRRGTRSLGYGFVTFEKEADAVAAISKFDKTEVDGRQLNVELAKPAAAKSGPGRVPKAAAEAAAAAGLGGEEGAEGTATRGGRGKGRGGRRGTSRRPKPDGEADGEVEGLTEGVAAISTEDGAEPAARGRGKGRGRGRGAGRGRGRGAPRGPVGAPQGEPSKTLCFVANLPWSYDEEAVKAIFSGEIASIKLIKRNFGQNAGRSKGYAFVDFANEADQQAAIKLAGKEIEGRPLQVKVAIQSAEGIAGGDPIDESAAAEGAPAAQPAGAA